MRRIPAARKTEPSLLEQQTRSRFGFMTKFLLPLKPLFNETFGSSHMSAMNKAISANFKHVIPGTYPDWRVDFSKLLVGQGEIPGFCDLSVNVHIPGHLMFNWNGHARSKRAATRDRVYAVVYCEHLNLWLTYLDMVVRKDGSFILDAELFSGFPVHVYLGSISDVWNVGSDSQYLGCVEIL